MPHSIWYSSKWSATHSSILGLPLWLSWSRIRLQCTRLGFDPWVGKIPWRRERLPTPVFWPGEFHGLYSSWGGKESDTIEQLSLFTFTPYGYLKFMVSESCGPWLTCTFEQSGAEWNEGFPLPGPQPRWLVAETDASEILVWFRLIVL